MRFFFIFSRVLFYRRRISLPIWTYTTKLRCSKAQRYRFRTWCWKTALNSKTSQRCRWYNVTLPRFLQFITRTSKNFHISGEFKQKLEIFGKCLVTQDVLLPSHFIFQSIVLPVAITQLANAYRVKKDSNTTPVSSRRII